jgi:hypothetical protein
MQKNNIHIQDNFFDNDFFVKLQKEIVLLNFKSRFAEVKENSPDDIANHIYQRNYHHVSIHEDALVYHEVIKKIKKYFNFSVKHMISHYFLSFPNTPAIPHNDRSIYNCLIYLVGDKLINNGTGFYEMIKEECVLNTHVGFKENRAIFFDSKIIHSPLQFAGNSTPRYVMANFIHE